MAWTTPITWTDVVSDADDFNEQIRDNLLQLLSPPTELYAVDESSDYDTDITTYADVDGTGLSFTFDTNGGDILIGFMGSASDASSSGLIDVSVDGTRIAVNASGGLVSAGGFNSFCFCRWVRGLAAGSHTLTVQFRATTAGFPLIIPAGAGTSGEDLHPVFWAREVS